MLTSMRETENLIRRDLTNSICLAGSNHSSMEKLAGNKHVSKKELKRLLEKNREYLQMIEQAKNDLVKELIK